MSARKPPLIRCRCGRMHRSWNPHKVCNQCVREQLRERSEQLTAAARELETRHLRIDVTALERTRESWLAKQPAGHPWRVEPAAAPATLRSTSVSLPVDPPRQTVERRSRVAAGGGEA